MSYIGQNEDEWEAAQAKAEAKRRRRAKTTCPTCGKRVFGIKHHLRDVHNQRIVHRPKLIEVEPIPERINQ